MFNPPRCPYRHCANRHPSDQGDRWYIRCGSYRDHRPDPNARLVDQGGLLCVGSPRYVLAQMSSAGSPSGADCTGVLTCALTHAIMQLHGMTSGMTICVQFYYRDPLHPDVTGVGLSGGVRFSLLP